MKANNEADICHHCGQLLTEEAMKHIEETGGLLPKTPAQKQAERIAEEERIQTAIQEGLAAKLKETEKSPAELQAEEDALADTIANAKNAGLVEGQKLSEEQLNIKDAKIQRLEKQNRENEVRIKSMINSNTNGDSSELKGNLQHKSIGEILRDTFEEDVFKDFSVGEPGSDILQTVMRNGKECGKILWESKRLEPNQSFNQKKFIPKLLREKVEFEAFIATFVTNKFPVGKDRESGIELTPNQVNYIEKHGFYYCPMDEERILLLAAKQRAEAIANFLDMIPNDKVEAKDKIYNLMRGPKAKAVADLVNRKSDQLVKQRQAILAKAKTIADSAIDMVKFHDESHKLSREIINEQLGLMNEAREITGQDRIEINNYNEESVNAKDKNTLEAVK